MIIWVIKIIRTAGTISSKQNCLRCKSLQRVGVEIAKNVEISIVLAILMKKYRHLHNSEGACFAII